MIHRWHGENDIPEILPEAAPALKVAGSRMPAGVIAIRSKGWRTRKLARAGWKSLETPNALVHGDAPAEGLRAAGVYAEELNVMLRAAFGSGNPKGMVKYVVTIYERHEELIRHARQLGASNAESFYDPMTGQIAFWFGWYATPELFQRAFAHEFTHAFMGQVFGRTSPLWFMEGTAEWFSNLDWRGSILVPGQIHRLSLAHLVMGGLNLPELLAAGREKMYGFEFPFLYAEAWSFIDYLFARHPGMVRDLLMGAEIVPGEHEEAWKEHVARLLETVSA